MKYGFVIDNRKCIGCHACTVACKSEHDVPIGVNRTWVKQTEKGEFPNTRRVFSVSRCNHCTDAPCVEICPVEALFVRDDGIVDFNNDRCIGCKSCMQACPYDALYIDPETHTAAKCNYCAHRVDVGLEPACVNVCPEHAIISGDMHNPETEIAQLLSREQVSVRKPEKGTSPNVFYIDGDKASLTPNETEKSDNYIWNSQDKGVGHYARFADELAADSKRRPVSNVEALMDKSSPRRVYDAPDKGILWGWEVSTYLFTKAISAGVFLVGFLTWANGYSDKVDPQNWWWLLGLSLFFLTATGGFLVKDLDQPKRFLYVLLRPQWNSWLVRGGYFITIFGALLTLWGLSMFYGLWSIEKVVMWLTAVFALLTAVYTAFLFAQAKGRDFWQSPVLPIHMILHSLIAGIATILVFNSFLEISPNWEPLLSQSLFWLLLINIGIVFFELSITHPTEDAKRVAAMITKGSYSKLFWGGVVVLGSILPTAILWYGGNPVIPSLLVLIGLYLSEHIWVEAPQKISLS